MRALSTRIHCVRIFVDVILDEVPEDVSDEDYDVIETDYLQFRRDFYKNLKTPYDSKAPSWYVIKDGKVVLCEGYSKIPQFQGREEEIAQNIEKAISK